jgi:hypothetical protein
MQKHDFLTVISIAESTLLVGWGKFMDSNSTKYRMKTFKFLIVGAFILTMNSVQAQRDMILTQAGEELRCRIVDETPVRFVFAYLKDGKPYRSEIFKTLVISFKFDYYDADLPNVDKLPEAMYRAIGSFDSESPRALSSKNTSSKKERRRNRKSKEVAVEESLDDRAELEKESAESQVSRTAIENKENAKKPDEAKAIVNNEASGSEKEAKVLSQPKPVIDRTNKSTTTTPQTEQRNSSVGKNNANRTETSESVNNTKQEPKTDKIANVNDRANAIDIKEGDFEIKKPPSDKENISVANNTANTPTDISETEFPNMTINQKNRFRVGIKGGIGNRLDNNLQTTNSYDLYLEQLLRGWILGADVAYFPNDLVGFGAIFTDFKSRNSDSEIGYRNEFTGAEQVGSIANRRSVKFVGPALFFRKKLDYKTYVVLGLSPGYNFYNDKGSYDGVDYIFKGGGFGAASTLGIDFFLGNDVIDRDIILSFEAGYNYGKIDALDYGDARGMVDLPTSLDLSRLDFTIGLRFIRFPKYFRLTSY